MFSTRRQPKTGTVPFEPSIVQYEWVLFFSREKNRIFGTCVKSAVQRGINGMPHVKER